MREGTTNIHSEGRGLLCLIYPQHFVADEIFNWSVSSMSYRRKRRRKREQKPLKSNRHGGVATGTITRNRLYTVLYVYFPLRYHWQVKYSPHSWIALRDDILHMPSSWLTFFSFFSQNILGHLFSNVNLSVTVIYLLLSLFHTPSPHYFIFYLFIFIYFTWHFLFELKHEHKINLWSILINY